MDRSNRRSQATQPSLLDQQQLYYQQQQEQINYMQYQNSPFIQQSYTPLVSPITHNINNISLHNFTQLESPALNAQKSFEFIAPDNVLFLLTSTFYLLQTVSS